MNTARACLLACIAAAAAAQADDPLKSPACAQAIASLQSARNAGAETIAIEERRSAAAAICLGSAAPPQRPGRVMQPPVAVPPPQIDLPVPVAPLPPLVPAPPPVAIGRPPAPALCDAGGCWSSDGTHLRHVGPNLIGPNGLCTQQGVLIACP
ncbi:hypothetical protein WG902_02395 [Ramlibacter sp. PS3R-8]|uniref:hypothetical protein n=1 Tax=Ramlibacter sp. PS3R-8 TaxID=3133437 RepID=UPI0030ADB4C7